MTHKKKNRPSAEKSRKNIYCNKLLSTYSSRRMTEYQAISKLRLTAGRTAHRYLRMLWMVPAFWATPNHGPTGKHILIGTFMIGDSISVSCIANAWLLLFLQWPHPQYPQYTSPLLCLRAWLSIDTQQTSWSAILHWSNPSIKYDILPRNHGLIRDLHVLGTIEWRCWILRWWD